MTTPRQRSRRKTTASQARQTSSGTATSIPMQSGQAPAVGISNRESPEQEARERVEFPPVNPSSPPPEDAGGSVGERGSSRDGRQTSHKAGSRSVAQKEAESKYADRSMPASRKVTGAFGREPG